MNLLDQTIAFAKTKLASFDGGHDWLHTERVLKMSQHIQQQEGAGDPEVIDLAAVLHDIADTKFHDGAETDGGNMAYDFLVSKGLDSEKAEHIRKIINNISFRKRMEREEIDTIEFQIVQDADRLDAMGAIGIARAFNYGGYKNRALYDPAVPLQAIPLQEKQTPGEERGSPTPSPTLNHFYEKLFLLKDMMNTATGRELALERH
ncbi:MAG: HD domain-containing protein, partial [Bacteroidales bacterium]|nr:HD domain-containing protein [Bacteroidales bacterium]